MTTEDVVEPDEGPPLAPTSHESPVFLVGFDGSAASNRAIEFVARRATATGGSMVVVHVIDWSPYTWNTPQENEQRHRRRQEEIAAANKGLEPAVARARELGADVTSAVHHGHPAQTMVDLAHKLKATHIVVGRTGQSRVRSLLFGSTPSHLIQVADVPVTVVP